MKRPAALLTDLKKKITSPSWHFPKMVTYCHCHVTFVYIRQPLPQHHQGSTMMAVKTTATPMAATGVTATVAGY